MDDIEPIVDVIDTAPKDSSARLLFVPDAHGGEWHVGWWEAGPQAWDSKGWDWRNGAMLPTHWAELPPKPDQ